MSDNKTNQQSKKRHKQSNNSSSSGRKSKSSSKRSKGGNDWKQPSLFNLDPKIVITIIWWGSFVLTLILGWTVVGPLLPIIPALSVLLMEKDNQLVRSHAGQAMVINLLMMILSYIIVILTVSPIGLLLIGLIGMVSLILGLVSLIVAIIATIKGLNYEKFEIPIIGSFGKMFAEKIKLG